MESDCTATSDGQAENFVSVKQMNNYHVTVCVKRKLVASLSRYNLKTRSKSISFLAHLLKSGKHINVPIDHSLRRCTFGKLMCISQAA